MINGATYAVFAPVFGLICDLWLPPIVLTTMGSVLITLSFVSLGVWGIHKLHTLTSKREEGVVKCQWSYISPGGVSIT